MTSAAIRILLVDDNRTNLLFLTKLVEKLHGCEALAFTEPTAVLAALPGLDFDLAVIDYQMPGCNGVELLKAINRFERYRDRPVVMVTADTDMTTRMASLEAGAIDFLNKPVHPLEFQARMRNLIALVEARRTLADRADWLRREVEKAVAELRGREEEIIDRLSLAASYKDVETGLHTRRVSAYAEAIARAYGLEPDICSNLRLAAVMHDIGKVGIPDSVLLKKGKLTPEEFAVIQKHTLIGRDILCESRSTLLQLAAEVAATHHERWDGNGYPAGLAGNDIPVSGRIVALADNFDALTTRRPYKPAWSEEEAIAYIREQSGTQFDARCVAAFESALPEILHIKAMHVDPDIEQPVCAVR